MQKKINAFHSEAVPARWPFLLDSFAECTDNIPREMIGVNHLKNLKLFEWAHISDEIRWKMDK